MHIAGHRIPPISEIVSVFCCRRGAKNKICFARGRGRQRHVTVHSSSDTASGLGLDVGKTITKSKTEKKTSPHLRRPKTVFHTVILCGSGQVHTKNTKIMIDFIISLGSKPQASQQIYGGGTLVCFFESLVAIVKLPEPAICWLKTGSRNFGPVPAGRCLRFAVRSKIRLDRSIPDENTSHEQENVESKGQPCWAVFCCSCVTRSCSRVYPQIPLPDESVT